MVGKVCVGKELIADFHSNTIIHDLSVKFSIKYFIGGKDEEILG